MHKIYLKVCPKYTYKQSRILTALLIYDNIVVSELVPLRVLLIKFVSVVS